MDHYDNAMMSTNFEFGSITNSDWWKEMADGLDWTTHNWATVYKGPFRIISAQLHLLMDVLPFGDWKEDGIMNPDRELMFAGTIMRAWSDPQVQQAFKAIMNAYDQIWTKGNGFGYFSPTILGNMGDLLGMVIATMKMMLQSPTVAGYMINRGMLNRFEAMHSAIQQPAAHKLWRNDRYHAKNPGEDPSLVQEDDKLWGRNVRLQRERANKADQAHLNAKKTAQPVL